MGCGATTLGPRRCGEGREEAQEVKCMCVCVLGVGGFICGEGVWGGCMFVCERVGVG